MLNQTVSRLGTVTHFLKYNKITNQGNCVVNKGCEQF